MNEIYEAIYTQLNDNLAIGVYDHVPDDLNTYPYIRVTPFTNNENDTDLETGFSSTVQITSFSQYRGSKEAVNIAEQVYTLLHRWDMPDTATYGVSSITQSFSDIATNPDGLTRHGVQRFTIFFEPLP